MTCGKCDEPVKPEEKKEEGDTAEKKEEGDTEE